MPEYTYTDPAPAASDSGYTYTDPAPQPGIMSRIGNQVGDFFSTAAHTMNPENLMAQVPTSWQDLKDKWQAENEDLKAHGQGAVNQFKQGNIGTGVSTLMNAEPFIGQPTGQAAEYLRQGDVGKAAGTLAPYFTPALPEGASAAGRGVKNATNAGLDWAADASVPLQNKAAQMINAHPTIAKGVVGAASAVPVYMAAHGLSHDVGLSGLGSLYAAREAAKHFGNAAVDWAKNYPDLAEPEPIIPAKGSPSQSGVPIPRGDVYTGTTGTAAPASAFTGTVASPSSTPPAPETGIPISLLNDVAIGQGKAKSFQALQNSDPERAAAVKDIAQRLWDQQNPTQPPPTQPDHVSAPQRAIPQTTQVATPQLQEGKPTVIGAQVIPHQTVPNSVIVNHVSPADGVPASMISPTGLGKFASENGMSVDQAKAVLRSDGYTPLTMGELTQGLNSIYNQLFGAGKMSKADIHAGIGQKLMADHPGLPEPSAASPEQKLWTYGDMLHTPIARSAENVGNVAYKHMTSENRAPVPSNLTNVTPFGWPPQQ